MNKIKLEDGRITDGSSDVFLRGVSIPDLHEISVNRNYSVKRILKDVKSKGFNSVRIPIHPGRYDMIEGYLAKFVDEAVKITEELGLYCVLDWHGIGNPISDQTRRPGDFFEKNGEKYLWHDVNIELAFEGWKDISSRYGGEKHVIFEVFNEPAPGEKSIEIMDIKPLFWDDWREKLEKIRDIIRESSDNLVILSPVGWAYDIEHVLKKPVKGDNLLYSMHPYPIHKGWREIMEKASDLPLVVTEWGFMENCDEEFMSGDVESYGKKILDFMEENRVHWFGWCFDDIWDPKMFKSHSYSKELTTWGEFLMKEISRITS